MLTKSKETKIVRSGDGCLHQTFEDENWNPKRVYTISKLLCYVNLSHFKRSKYPVTHIWWRFYEKARSSYRRYFVRKGVLKNSTNFTGKHVLEWLFNKVAGLKNSNIGEKRLQRRSFLVKFVKVLRTPILENIGERLLLERFQLYLDISGNDNVHISWKLFPVNNVGETFLVT